MEGERRPAGGGLEGPVSGVCGGAIDPENTVDTGVTGGVRDTVAVKDTDGTEGTEVAETLDAQLEGALRRLFRYKLLFMATLVGLLVAAGLFFRQLRLSAAQTVVLTEMNRRVQKAGAAQAQVAAWTEEAERRREGQEYAAGLLELVGDPGNSRWSVAGPRARLLAVQDGAGRSIGGVLFVLEPLAGQQRPRVWGRLEEGGWLSLGMMSGDGRGPFTLHVAPPGEALEALVVTAEETLEAVVPTEPYLTALALPGYSLRP